MVLSLRVVRVYESHLVCSCKVHYLDSLFIPHTQSMSSVHPIIPISISSHMAIHVSRHDQPLASWYRLHLCAHVPPELLFFLLCASHLCRVTAEDVPHRAFNLQLHPHHSITCPLHCCSLSCINEYMAIDSGGNVSDLVLARNCCLARMLPGEAENGVGMNRSVGEGKKCEAL